MWSDREMKEEMPLDDRYDRLVKNLLDSFTIFLVINPDNYLYFEIFFIGISCDFYCYVFQFL